MNEYTCIESFSGCGGLALGVMWAGFDVRVAFDCDVMAVETYNRNLGPHCLVADARRVSGKDLLQRASLRVGECDLFSGGPPCQGFSKQKRGAENGDIRNQLILEYIRLVREIQPKFFVLENVDQFGKKRGMAFVQALAAELRTVGYDIFHHYFNSADFGLAQTRVRYMILGKREDVRHRFALPRPTHASRWRTVGEVIGDLPDPPTDYTDHPLFPNHQNARVTEINIKRFSFVPAGGGWQDIPAEYRLRCHAEKPKSGGWPDVYGRLKYDGQCPTITGGFDSFTRGRYGHPLRDRPLTPREAARLQGFPDDFIFFGTRAHVRSQIGNAVPPPLAQAVGRSVIECLNNRATSDSQTAARLHQQPSLWT